MKCLLKSISVTWILLLCAGCSTTGRQVIYDNTVLVTKRPLSGTAEFGWRVKTFWTEEMTSLWRRRVSFPLLARRTVPELNTDAPTFMNRDIMAEWLCEKTGPPVAGSATLLLNGENFFPRFGNAIHAATNRILLKTYIFDNDDVAKQVADELKARSSEIDIRILYDSGGSRIAWKTDAPSRPTNSVDEVDDMIRYLADDSQIELRRANHTLLTSEHSKYILIDSSAAYFGGMNIGREYRYDWRDAMFELHGPVLDALECRFDQAWRIAGGGLFSRIRRPAVPDTAAGDLYLIETTPLKANIYRAQIHAIQNARQRIYIENPYLWNPAILYHLCAARKRGVDVRVTLPRDVNHGIGISANKLTVNRLLEHGVRVFIYPGMTHVKAAVYDQWACFGSANFDDLSLHKNYELNLFTDNPEIVGEITKNLLLDGQQRSTEVFNSDRLSPTELFTARFAQYL
ncbi:MAG: phosphatidylserine/phosphatidylglycerophosphate/cardiolipin synthase family protein [Kiritimatiellales bacterium]